jgi:hypothetical protein
MQFDYYYYIIWVCSIISFTFLVSLHGGRQPAWNVGHCLAYCTIPGWWIMMSVETVGGMVGRGNRSTRSKPASVPFCPPQIPHGLTRARTLASAVESQRLTAWAMARPFIMRVASVSVIFFCYNYSIPWSRVFPSHDVYHIQIIASTLNVCSIAASSDVLLYVAFVLSLRVYFNFINTAFQPPEFTKERTFLS